MLFQTYTVYYESQISETTGGFNWGLLTYNAAT